MKTTLQVEDELLREFQEAVTEEFGKLKGAQSEALNEAMKLWLAFRGKKRFFTIIGPQGVRVAGLKEAVDELVNALREGRVQAADTRIVPLFDSFDREELREMLEAAKSVLGPHFRSEGSIEELEHDEDYAVYSWNIRNGRGGYSLRFTMRMSLCSIVYNRLWSREVTNIKDLLWSQADEEPEYDITYDAPSGQPSQGRAGA